MVDLEAVEVASDAVAEQDLRSAADIEGELAAGEFELPELEWLQEHASKNPESYLGDLAEEDDSEELCRVQITIDNCPFGGDKCRGQLWNKAAVWTMLKDHRCCVLYAFHHATNSGAHWLHPEAAYSILLEHWGDISWSVKDDGFDSRQAYRSHLKQLERSHEGRIQKDGRLPPQQPSAPPPAAACRLKLTGKMPTPLRPTPPSAPSPVKRKRVGSVPIGAMPARRPAASSGSASSTADIAEIASSAAMKTLLAYGIQPFEERSSIQISSESSALVPIAGGGRFPVSVATESKIVQDAVQRSEHAISSSLAAHVETAKKLSSERQTIHDALQQLSMVTGKPVKNWSVGMDV